MRQFCKIQGGSLGNIFPDIVELEGGCRYFKKNGGEKILNIMKRMAEGISISHNVKISVENNPEISVPAIINNKDSIKNAISLLENIEGLKLYEDKSPIVASDNFGEIINKYKGFTVF